MATSGPRPFIKWAGGKGQLIASIASILPTKIRTYYEPFLGGGALFWHVAHNRTFDAAVLNDWNQELVDTYTAIRDVPELVIAALNEHKNKAWNTAEYFYETRALDPASLSTVARAARMIYLNKTCYNGLYRVNKSGGFNSPFGRYKNPGLLDSGNIRACALALKRNVVLGQGDFTKVFATAGPGDLAYFDPPYVPVSDTANFASYTKDGFTLKDQQRLAACFRNLTDKDVSCILSNSDTEIIRNLYEGFEIIPVQVKRHINSKAGKRGGVGEVLVLYRGQAHRAEQRFDFSVLGE